MLIYFVDQLGHGKTTSARIVANLINENKAKPIELDCASNNGVDDVRMIIDECRTKPIDSKYKIFVLDECHQLTVQGWNAMLKILEEPPPYVIFMFCTTDPQKIIGTVLSRVQRFNFQRISQQGIYNRLKYIIDSENVEKSQLGEPLIIYEDDAIKYIARLAKGGMRDSITTLEKCLDYSLQLTTANVLKVTSGSVTEETCIQLTDYIINQDIKNALLYFNTIYMSGIEISLFIKLYAEFLQNCVKYLITRSANITTISDVALDWANQRSEFLPNIKWLMSSVMSIKTNHSAEDLKILLESWLMEVCS